MLCRTRVCGAAAANKHRLTNWAQTQNITCLDSQCTNQVLQVRSVDIYTCPLRAHVDSTWAYCRDSGSSCAGCQNTILLCCSDMSQMGDARFEFFWLPLASLTNSVDLRSKLQRCELFQSMKLIRGLFEKDGLISHSKNKRNTICTS